MNDFRAFEDSLKVLGHDVTMLLHLLPVNMNEPIPPLVNRPALIEWMCFPASDLPPASVRTGSLDLPSAYKWLLANLTLSVLISLSHSNPLAVLLPDAIISLLRILQLLVSVAV